MGLHFHGGDPRHILVKYRWAGVGVTYVLVTYAEAGAYGAESRGHSYAGS